MTLTITSLIVLTNRNCPSIFFHFKSTLTPYCLLHLRSKENKTNYNYSIVTYTHRCTTYDDACESDESGDLCLLQRVMLKIMSLFMHAYKLHVDNIDKEWGSLCSPTPWLVCLCMGESDLMLENVRENVSSADWLDSKIFCWTCALGHHMAKV